MSYNDPDTQSRLESVCDSHFPNDCANCPLRAACEAGKNAGETDAEFTARWESGMVAALKSTMEV